MTPGKVTGANVSVRIDDDFMRAVEAGTPYTQKFPVNSDEPLVTKEIDAAALWRKIVTNAWKSAEPGVLSGTPYAANRYPTAMPTSALRPFPQTPAERYPCPYDSCRLLAINLYSFVKAPFTPEATFDYEHLTYCVRRAQRIMDDIIDLEMEKIDLILKK